MKTSSVLLSSIAFNASFFPVRTNSIMFYSQAKLWLITKWKYLTIMEWKHPIFGTWIPIPLHLVLHLWLHLKWVISNLIKYYFCQLCTFYFVQYIFILWGIKTCFLSRNSILSAGLSSFIIFHFKNWYTTKRTM